MTASEAPGSLRGERGSGVSEAWPDRKDEVSEARLHSKNDVSKACPDRSGEEKSSFQRSEAIGR